MILNRIVKFQLILIKIPLLLIRILWQKEQILSEKIENRTLKKTKRQKK